METKFIYKVKATSELKKLGFEYLGCKSSRSYTNNELSVFNKVVHVTGMLLGSAKSGAVIDFILNNIHQPDSFWMHKPLNVKSVWNIKHQWCITQHSNEIITQEEYYIRFDKYINDLYKQGGQLPDVTVWQKISAEHNHIDRTPVYISLEIVNEIKKIKHLLIKEII